MALHIRVVLSFLVALLPLCVANSFGRPGLCDSHPATNWGCTAWGVDSDGAEDRLNCIDQYPGHMYWATRPVRTPAFSIDVPSTYTPGQFLKVVVNVNHYEMKYRGILLHATDSANSSVGEFPFPDEDDGKFHTPMSHCPHAALHADAEPKPFKAEFRFKAPNVGTGDITFRALFKTGPANTGDFWYPAVDPVLTEAVTLPPSTMTWILADEYQTCHDACKSARLECSGDELASITGPNSFITAVGSAHLGSCQFPLLSDCSPVSPVRSQEGQCYFRDQRCSSKNLCFAKGLGSENSNRFCPCESSRRALRSTNIKDVPSSSSLTIQQSAFATIASVGALAALLYALSNSKVFSVLLLPTTAAHNWLHTPARANKEASTTKPCRGRKLTDTHAQVGPGQNFNVKWATGHSGQSILLTVHEKNQHFLHHADLVDMIEEYLNEPEATNSHGVQKYHGTTDRINDHTFYDEQIEDSDGLYTREVKEGDEDWVTHPRAETNRLYEYSESIRADDRYSDHRSAKFPWIDSAGFFPHNMHLPKDFDSVNLKISGHHGPGHYITFWKWRGYYDCIDVDYFDDREVENVYGEGSGEYQYSRLDHCSYIEPKDVVSDPLIMDSDSAEACIEAVDGGLNNNVKTKKRLGVNIVPLQKQERVTFDASDIPWSRRQLGGDLSGVTSPVQTWKFIPLDNWKRDEYAETKCEAELWSGTMTFREAILRCSVDECFGITFKGNSVPSNALYSASEYEFGGCGSTVSVSHPEYKTFMKTLEHITTIDFLNAPALESFKVSFQRSSVEAVGDELVDFGEVYDSVRGYGWNCGTTRNRYFVTDNNGAEQLTFLRNMNDLCDDGSARIWEVAVPNGVYRVTTHHEKGKPTDRLEYNGLSIENVKASDPGQPNAKRTEDLPLYHTRIVEVTDGKMSLQAGPGCTFDENVQGQTQCLRTNILNDILVESLGEDVALTEVWFPPVSNAWTQVTFNNNKGHGIGLVTITLPGAVDGRVKGEDDNRSWLFMKGNKLRVGSREQGRFEGEEEGAVVELWQGSTKVKNCSILKDANHCSYSTVFGFSRISELCPYEVSCGGAAGDRVRVRLPGQKRVVDVEVDIHWSDPGTAKEELQGKSLCYGVEPRLMKDVEPEFIITDDPLDPRFYSTCFVREEMIEYLDPPSARVEEEPGWKFNGMCLECSTWERNMNMSASNNFFIPSWAVGGEGGPYGQCLNCEVLSRGKGVGAGAVSVSEVYDPDLWPVAFDFGNSTGPDGCEFLCEDGMIFDSQVKDVMFFCGCGVLFIGFVAMCAKAGELGWGKGGGGSGGVVQRRVPKARHIEQVQKGRKSRNLHSLKDKGFEMGYV